MKKISILTICIVMFSMTNYAQELNSNNSAYEKYLSEQETLNQSISEYIYGNFTQIYSSNESKFVVKSLSLNPGWLL